MPLAQSRRSRSGIHVVHAPSVPSIALLTLYGRLRPVRRRGRRRVPVRRLARCAVVGLLLLLSGRRRGRGIVGLRGRRSRAVLQLPGRRRRAVRRLRGRRAVRGWRRMRRWRRRVAILRSRRGGRSGSVVLCAGSLSTAARQADMITHVRGRRAWRRGRGPPVRYGLRWRREGGPVRCWRRRIRRRRLWWRPRV
jgi:hypothetical protein